MLKGTRIEACVTWFPAQTALESSVNHICRTLCLGPSLLHSLKWWTGSCAAGRTQNSEQLSADLQVGPFLDRHTTCGLCVCSNYILKIKQQKNSKQVPFKVENCRKKKKKSNQLSCYSLEQALSPGKACGNVSLPSQKVGKQHEHILYLARLPTRNPTNPSWNKVFVHHHQLINS